MTKLTLLARITILTALLNAGCDSGVKRPNFGDKEGAQTADSQNYNTGPVTKDADATSSSSASPTSAASPASPASPAAPAATPSPSSGMVSTTPGPVATIPPVTAVGTTDACKSFSWESIKTPEEALCFKGIDEVFASMPERVRSNWVLIHKTRSAQPASVTKPRMLMVSPDGTFLVATATDQSTSKDLEFAVYDYKKNVWQFAGIDFSQNPPKVEKELCKTCHGQEPHPIWTEYPEWPSAFSGDQKLTADQAAVLNEIASKKSTLPFVKHLKTRTSYRAGDILYPASKYIGSENNQTLNIVIAIKAARSLVSKLYEKNTSEANLVKIAGDALCSGRETTLTSLGFNADRELNHGLVGKDRETVIWAGNASGTEFVGIEILNQLYKKVPTFKSKYPQITKFLDTKEFKFYGTENLAQFFAAEDDLQGSWQNVDNNFLRGTFRPAFRSGSAVCKELGQ